MGGKTSTLLTPIQKFEQLDLLMQKHRVRLISLFLAATTLPPQTEVEPALKKVTYSKAEV